MLVRAGAREGRAESGGTCRADRGQQRGQGAGSLPPPAFRRAMEQPPAKQEAGAAPGLAAPRGLETGPPAAAPRQRQLQFYFLTCRSSAVRLAVSLIPACPIINRASCLKKKKSLFCVEGVVLDAILFNVREATTPAFFLLTVRP